jgi:hypothetical protein
MIDKTGKGRIWPWTSRSQGVQGARGERRSLEKTKNAEGGEGVVIGLEPH